MKAILVIADGLGGRPTDFNGKTCLEAASTPNLDELASKGINGMLYPIKPGVRPGSDTAHLSIFGYDPYKFYTGRGVFEALGVGMEVKEGDICFRTNFATIKEDFTVLDRRAGRIKEGTKELENALHKLDELYKDVRIIFKASVEHRGALILRGRNLSHQISDADPHKTGVKIEGAKPLVGDDKAKRTAEIVNRIIKESYRLLKDHPINLERKKRGALPANVILPRGASIKIKMPSLKELYGIKGIAVAGGALYIGIARAIGLEIMKAKGATGRADTNVINKMKVAIEGLKQADFAFIHIKGADSCAHDRDAEAKIRFIEKIDEGIGYLMDNVDWGETHIAFTGDHSTPIAFGDHSADPVPIVISGPNVVRDDVKEFNERSALRGGLGKINGNVVPILFGYCDWLEKYGT